jgi:NADH-quinone oxidoreductase subunit L
VIGSLALAGFPLLAGFWSKDEILLGASENGYELFLVVGLVGAFMTAAYMTRCVYLTFYGERRGHAHAHESPPPITVPLLVLAGLSLVAGLFNAPFFGYPFADLTVNETIELAGVVEHPFSILDALISAVVALSGIAVAGALYFGARLPVDVTGRNRLAHAGYTLLVNKYYLDHLYNNVIVYAFKKPFANAAYWFNQKVLDGIVDGSGKASVMTGRAVYKYIDQGLVDGIVNGSGVASDEAGQGLRKMQTGKVQQYAAIMFAAVAILAGILVIVVQ